MCGHCGCGETEGVVLHALESGRRRTLTGDGAETAHEHPHADHHHHHAHAPGSPAVHHHAPDGTVGEPVTLETRILAENERRAARNRAFFAGREMLVVNLLSSPGAGKTTLLEALIPRLRERLPVRVIEGDQATSRDGERIRKAGAPVVQINTGTGCHLESTMVAAAVAELAPPPGSLLVIENVGNLVCPALFDLGETVRVVLASPTEGEDKPLKYPHMFRSADLVLLGKADLLPHLAFDTDAFRAALEEVAPGRRLLEISARSGEGLDALARWLEDRHREVREGATRQLVQGEVR